MLGIYTDAPNARVLVVGYPAIVPNTGDGCWPVVPIAFGDVPYLRGVEKELNAMLATEAAANKATYVDTYTASIGHDACEARGQVGGGARAHLARCPVPPERPAERQAGQVWPRRS